MLVPCLLPFLIAAALLHLLETAVLRSKFCIISSLTRMPAAKQLSEAQLCRLLRQALLLEQAETCRFSDVKHKWDSALHKMVDVAGVVQELCRSSVVQQAVSSADELFLLLRVAVAQGNSYSAVAALCILESAALHTTSEQLAQLLQLGMCAGTQNLQQLDALSSAVQVMPVEPLEALLLQAVQQQGETAAEVVQCLGGAPAVRQLSRPSVLQLVSAALQGSRACCNIETHGDSLDNAESERQMLCALFKGHMGVALQAVLGPAGSAEAVKQALSIIIITELSHSINAIDPAPHRLDITRQTPLLPQTSSETKRNNLIDASDSARTLRNFSAPPTTWRRTERISSNIVSTEHDGLSVSTAAVQVRCSNADPSR
jgi:hypothetical protein